MKNDFPRLSESSTSSLVRGLLRTAGSDKAPSPSRQRALVAASLAASTVAVSSGTAAASALTASAAGLALKWLGTGFLIGCVSMGTMELTRRALPDDSGPPRRTQGAKAPPTELRPAPAAARRAPGVAALTFAPSAESTNAQPEAVEDVAGPAPPGPGVAAGAAPAPVLAAGATTAAPSRIVAPSPAPGRPAAARTESEPPLIDRVTRPFGTGEVVAARAFPIEAAAVTAAPPAVKPVPSSAPPKDTFAVELGLVDQARKAVAAGNAGTALALLDRLEREHRGGSFGPEATALRVEVLMRSGQREAAEALAQRFTAQHPNHPLARRVRALVAAPAGR